MIEPAIPADFWDHYPAVLHPTRPPIALGNAGGLSGSDLWRVDSPAGPLMLRAWPAGMPRERVDQIHFWLDQARRLSLLAIPLAGRSGATWQWLFGRFWEITPFLPGSADLGRPPDPVHLATMFATLAQVHAALAPPVARGPSPGLSTRRDEIKRLLAGEFERLDQAVGVGSTQNGAAGPLARQWLDGGRRVAPGVLRILEPAAERVFDLQPVLRDVRPDHFLFTDERLTGLVDFGAMGIDSVATDLARLLGESVGRSVAARQVALDAYEAVRPITLADRAAIGDFEAANALLGGARWVRWHFIQGRSFGDPGAVKAGLSRALLKLGEWEPSLR